MTILTKYNEIPRSAWAELIRQSSTSTWFQTCEAYDFYAAQSELFTPFVVVVEDANSRNAAFLQLIKQTN